MSNIDDAFLLLTLSLCIKRKKTRRWTREWLNLRNKYTHENLLREILRSEPEDYTNFLRMDHDTFEKLLTLLRPHIEKVDTVMRQAIPASQRLSITLRYLASGADFEDLKFSAVIAPRTLSDIVIETCEAINETLRDNVQVPKTEEDWKILAEQFGKRWNFDNCIGAVDGKHVTLQKPEHSGSYYYNYKGTYSIVLMAIANANYEFIMVDVGTNGRVSDGGVIKNTKFWHCFENNQLQIPEPEKLPRSDKKMPFVFVGDEAFQLLPNFMKPFNKQVLTDNRRIFNYRLSRARRIIENVFGILVSRFKIFQKPIKLSPPKAQTVNMACCHLHNFLMKQKKYIQRGEVDVEDCVTGTVTEGTWRIDPPLLSIARTRAGNSAAVAKQVRDDFCEYFNTTGAVSWQNKCLQ